MENKRQIVRHCELMETLKKSKREEADMEKSLLLELFTFDCNLNIKSGLCLVYAYSADV